MTPEFLLECRNIAKLLNERLDCIEDEDEDKKEAKLEILRRTAMKNLMSNQDFMYVIDYLVGSKNILYDQIKSNAKKGLIDINQYDIGRLSMVDDIFYELDFNNDN